MSSNEYADPPKWLDQDFVVKVLQEFHKDDKLTISELLLVGACSKGDNYSSIMSRVTCTISSRGTTSREALIIKTMPEAEIAARYVTETKSFEHEITMMADVIPSIEEIFKTKTGFESEPLAPRVIYSALKPNPVIVMEDLCETKFSVGDRFLGLNYEQCLAVIKSLAKLHMGTAALMKERPELEDEFIGGMWGAENARNNERLIIDGIAAIVKHIDNWSGEKWSDKIKQLADRMPGHFYEIYDKTDSSKLRVINHGDLWTNNVMLRYRGCGLFDVRFIDLQLSTYKSPVFDLMYFIFTSPTREVRFKYLDSFLKAYHEKLTEFSELLDLPIDYSFENMNKEMKDKLVFGFFCFYGVRAVTTAPKADAVDVSTEIIDMTESPIFKNKQFQESFVDGLTYFHENGLF